MAKLTDWTPSEYEPKCAIRTDEAGHTMGEVFWDGSADLPVRAFAVPAPGVGVHGIGGTFATEPEARAFVDGALMAWGHEFCEWERWRRQD